jgi:hypothetical protein
LLLLFVAGFDAAADDDDAEKDLCIFRGVKLDTADASVSDTVDMEKRISSDGDGGVDVGGDLGCNNNCLRRGLPVLSLDPSSSFLLLSE